MPRLPLVSALIPALLFLLSGPVHSETLLFAELTNEQEVPPAVPLTSTGDPRPKSFGTATFSLNDARDALSFSAMIFNIDFDGTQTPDTFDNMTNAHIHVAPPGDAGPVIWGFRGDPFNNTMPEDTVFTKFASGVGGTVTATWNLAEGFNTTLADQLDNILAGQTYINFHTVQFGGGEIRGQIVPEPSTMIMLAFGGVVLLIGWRRRWGNVQPG
jgi:hypothetical protein